MVLNELVSIVMEPDEPCASLFLIEVSRTLA